MPSKDSFMKSHWFLGSLLLSAPLLFGGPAAAEAIDLTGGGAGDISIKFNNYESLRWTHPVGQFGGLDKLGSGFVRPPISQPQVPSMHHLACVRPAWNVGVWHYSS